MATDWAGDVRKYAPDADDSVIAGIVRYCGIALRNVDSSLVSFSDPAELARVRNNFLKKKCGLTDPDDMLDAAIADVGERMKSDRTKNRVTVYYLLSERFGMHSLFVKAPKAPAAKAVAATAVTAGGAAAAVATLAALDADADAKDIAEPGQQQQTAAPLTSGADPAPVDVPAEAAAPAPVDVPAVVEAAAAAPAVAPAEAAALETSEPAATRAPDSVVPAAASLLAGAGGMGAAGVAASALGHWSGDSSPLGRRLLLFSEGGAGKEIRLFLWAALALMVLAIAWLFLFHKAPPAPAPVAAPVAAPAAAPPVPTAPAAVPEGAGIVAETRDAKPVVKVYFALGKADVAPAFATEIAALQAYLGAHAGGVIGVSGYNDPSGNAAANALLSKRRAQAVKAALVGAGIPEASIELIKPASTSDAAVTPVEARRVEVYVK